MKRIHFTLLMAAFFVAGCDKSLDVDVAPDFQVTTKKNIYHVGEEINFQLEGDPGILTFYSGEVGHDFDFLEGRIVPAGELKFSFSSKVFYGERSPGQLDVLISTDFNGSYNIDDIKAATWIAITDRFILPLNDGQDFVESGQADISDLAEEGQNMYFAFKYRFDPTIDSGIAWRVRDFAVTNENMFGLKVLMTQANALFGLYFYGPKVEGRSSTNRSSMTLKQNLDKQDYTEDWCISTGIELGGPTDLGPDRPIVIKGYSGEHKDSFRYTYSEPGKYKVRFVATNTTIKESKTVIKELDIEIIP